MSRLSINQAAKEFGVSRERIRKAIKSNDLTSQTGARNAQTLDVVILYVFLANLPTSRKQVLNLIQPTHSTLINLSTA